MKLSEVKAASYNPRKISGKALSGLKESVKSFGDISGIVINTRSGNLVSGHQRIKALIEAYGDLEINSKGYIVTPDGESFKVRYVDWSIEKEKMANVAANNPHIAGRFDWEELDVLLAEIQEDDENCELFNNLNFDDLLVDVAEYPGDDAEEDAPPQEKTTDADWIDFQVGDIKGKLFIDVYNMFLSEWDRLKGVTDSEKVTTNFEAMIVNSANTPTESIK